MNFDIDPDARYDLTIRYRDPDTKERTTHTEPSISHADLVATLTTHRVPLLTAMQSTGVCQMSDGPQLSWKPTAEEGDRG
ncbi:hypothetical protein PV646_28495 [Streptomyces sp. ID05-26A]|nr:hypothetical protein [Streptomyces sp. ID05-26A]